MEGVGLRGREGEMGQEGSERPSPGLARFYNFFFVENMYMMHA
jgi:hypothetical protein